MWATLGSENYFSISLLQLLLRQMNWYRTDEPLHGLSTTDMIKYMVYNIWALENWTLTAINKLLFTLHRIVSTKHQQRQAISDTDLAVRREWTRHHPPWWWCCPSGTSPGRHSRRSRAAASPRASVRSRCRVSLVVSTCERCPTQQTAPKHFIITMYLIIISTALHKTYLPSVQPKSVICSMNERTDRDVCERLQASATSLTSSDRLFRKCSTADGGKTRRPTANHHNSDDDDDTLNVVCLRDTVIVALVNSILSHDSSQTMDSNRLNVHQHISV